MIANIQGRLTGLTSEKARIDTGTGITYEVLLPAYAVARLGGSIDQEVSLHTLHFMESSGQGATIFPRLAGFLTEEDKAFYELFVTTKGIGHRKALRAMVLASSQIAAAIEDRDLATLQSLPEVGKRTAETIAASLRGKVQRFLNAPASTTDSPTDAPPPPRNSIAREALEALIMLGEKRTDALRWIDQVLHEDDPPTKSDELIAAVYRIKGG